MYRDSATGTNVCRESRCSDDLFQARALQVASVGTVEILEDVATPPPDSADVAGLCVQLRVFGYLPLHLNITATGVMVGCLMSADRGGGVLDRTASPARCAIALPPTTGATHWGRTAPVAASPGPHGTPPFTRGQALRTGDPGHLFSPNPAASSAGTLRPAGTWLCGDATLTSSGSRIRPAPRHPFQSRTPFQCTTWNRPRMPESPKLCLRERWTCSSGINRPKRQLFVDAFKLPPRKRPGRPKTKRPIRKPRRKPTVRKPAKKAKPKNQERRPRSKPTQAEVEAKRQEQLKFDRQRSKTPERREQNRLRAQEKRRSAKGLGLCRDCPNPSKPDETRCSTCTEKHRVGRRKNDAQRRAAAKLAETTDKADH